VRKFSPTGTSLATIGTWYGDVVSFPVVTYGKYPIAITVDAQSNVYATGTGPLEGFPFGFFVYKFSPSGDGYVESGSWGGIGSGDGQFIQPAGIAAYGGYVYVADSENQRVQKFTDDGQYVSQWFINASSPTLPNFNPADLAVDSSGNIFVSIPHSDCVLKFSGTGELLATIGVPHATGSSVEGEFDTPIGVAVDSGGYVYVADMFNSRIQKFAPPTTPPPPPSDYQFVFNSIPTPQYVGTPFSTSVTVLDASLNHISDYSGAATLTCSNGAGISPSTINIVNGYWEGTVTIDSPGTLIYLTATSTDGTTGDSINFNVISGVTVVPEPPFWLAMLCIAAAVALVTIYRKHPDNK
jgi:hypothetical protein